jgi:hypothetical protein
LAKSAAEGCVTVALAVALQELASVTVTQYVPVESPVAVAPVCTGLVAHE